MAVEQPGERLLDHSRALEEVARERRPVRRQHRLGMELDADRRQLAVPHGHHLAVVGERGRLEHVRQPRRGERVVAPGLERIRQPGEEAASVVPHGARLPVQELARVADLAAADLDERLVAEADAERRRRREEPLDDRGRRARGRRTAGPRRDDEVGGSEPLRLVGVDLVVPPHDDVRAERAEQVREVVRERVVVVDEEDHGTRVLLRLCQLDRGLERAQLGEALLVLGGRVRVGDDPAAGLQVRDAVAQPERADRDARVELSRLAAGSSRPRRRRCRAGTARAPR